MGSCHLLYLSRSFSFKNRSTSYNNFFRKLCFQNAESLALGLNFWRRVLLGNQIAPTKDLFSNSKSLNKVLLWNQISLEKSCYVVWFPSKTLLQKFSLKARLSFKHFELKAKLLLAKVWFLQKVLLRTFPTKSRCQSKNNREQKPSSALPPVYTGGSSDDGFFFTCSFDLLYTKKYALAMGSRHLLYLSQSLSNL